ncbi:hypothetical protein MUP01_03400 [Candidatus Bathyarchaeota archaeon]|nr:hypothetical protein [Candidatus Bathyarchaeota archaeon]
MPEKSLERELVGLRERTIRLEMQIIEVSKKTDAISNYLRQLHQYLMETDGPRWNYFNYEVKFQM